ncbi:MAG: iron-sulfur cluster repair di-iron protein [Gammaproteobacteria bacterium]|nr:iron-sulfur cluster repair di-iron protein [Gammaproteobacteria bacterium]
MTTGPTTPLKDIALSHPDAARILESFRLDYCCGGRKPLAEACAAAGLAVDEVLATLAATPGAADAEPGIEQDSLNALIRFIVDTHHAFTRTELLRIDSLLTKVVDRHAAAHPELTAIGARFRSLQADLEPHLGKEERILFPYIALLEDYRAGSSLKPEACFGTIDNPLGQMQAEHESVGALLGEIRSLSADFKPPADACASYRTVLQALEGLEADLMRHIHLENNVLFPRARQLADGL